MRFTLEYPSDGVDAAPEFMVPEVMTSLCKQAEQLGFDALALSDHPAPSVRWRRAGGHDTLEPAVALAFMAAATTHVRLMTNLYVLPFRNPYLTAKALTTLDIVSGGRLIAGVGAGYLRSEFAALGVDFDQRVPAFDSALAALTDIWAHPERQLSGENPEPILLSTPVQRPHPPIWIGGNSAATLRRVVRFGHGWCPVLAPAGVAASIRTQNLDTTARFGAAVSRLRDGLVAAARAPESVEVQVEVPMIDFDDPGSVRDALARLDELQSLGATRAIAHVPCVGAAAASEYMTAFADVVIGQTEDHSVSNSSTVASRAT